jgi:hypothetical protein
LWIGIAGAVESGEDPSFEPTAKQGLEDAGESGVPELAVGKERLQRYTFQPDIEHIHYGENDSRTVLEVHGGEYRETEMLLGNIPSRLHEIFPSVQEM